MYYLKLNGFKNLSIIIKNLYDITFKLEKTVFKVITGKWLNIENCNLLF